MRKNFNTKKEMVNYMSEILAFEPEISLVVSLDILDEIIDDIDYGIKELSLEKNSDYYTYVIDKWVDDSDEVHIFVEPITYDEDGLMDVVIENQFVVLESGLIDDENVESIVFEEELIILENDEDYYDECDYCEEKEYCKYNDENIEDDEIDEYIDAKINNFLDNDDWDLFGLLREIYDTAYEDGSKSTLLAIKEDIDDILED